MTPDARDTALEIAESNVRRAAAHKDVDAVMCGMRIDGKWHVACQGKRGSGRTLREAIERLGNLGEVTQ